ncbi:uncharacterized protein LOC118802708 [Colossoma macropomum]|uniref:uncharacterized protein LOC118802708 n=1 Tax=Colossoma macropomum TaxID=42526 RepID=UPI00186478F6|nr:uncharacterized protein LOC118802708 [Colossoma macropomum]
MRDLKMGVENDRQGVQTPICHRSTAIQGNTVLKSSGRISSCSSRGNILIDEKRSNKNCASQREHVRFLLKGVTYEHLVLPFGLSLSPRVFVKCTKAAVAPLRRKGIHLATYIEDWLLAAQSEQEAREHTRLLTEATGLSGEYHQERFNSHSDHLFHRVEPGLSFVQGTTIFGEGESFSDVSSPLSEGELRHFQAMSQTSVINGMVLVAVQFGRLYMREFQCWVASLRLNQLRHSHRRVLISVDCALALRQWRQPAFLTRGVPMGTILARKMVTSDASLSAGHHVLVRTDNTTVVAYINRQGGLRSRQLHTLAHLLIVWSGVHFLSLKATHVPSVLNRGADLLSRGNPRYGEWQLHRDVVYQIFGKAAVDLFATRENAQCPSFFSLNDQDAPMGVNALAHPWPCVLLYAFPPLALIPPTLTRRSPITSARGNLLPSSRASSSLGLTRERSNLTTVGLPDNVIATIQSARASSTRTLYGHKWRVFEEWCAKSQAVPFQCSIPVILSFLQELLEKGKAFSTIKVYLAAISSCHVGFDGTIVGQHPLICRFMKGARRLRPVSKSLTPSWDLSLVLEALAYPPFEPLHDVDLKTLSMKTALLLALASAKRVSEIHAFSVHPTCTQFAPADLQVILKPNPAFIPKIVDSSAVFPHLVLTAFYRPPFASDEQRRLHLLCPVRALRIYLNRTEEFKKTDQLFVSWARLHLGKPITKQRLSHWIVGAIALAYSSKSMQPPTGLRAHSTRGMATSWALFQGVSVQEICAAANWASPHTFIRFYRLDVTAPTLVHTVLSVCPPEGRDPPARE